MTTRITLIAHAPTDAVRRAAFPVDESLPERETAKLAATHWRAPRAQHFLSAPERRSQQTASGLGLSVDLAAELQDCDYGEWSGYTLSEISSRYPEKVAAWLGDPAAAPHGGESILQLIERAGRWLDAQRETGFSLAITHPAVIRAAICCALEAPTSAFWRIEISPLSLTDMRFNGRFWTLRSVGCALTHGAGPSE